MTVGDLLTMRPGLDCHYDGGVRTLNEMRASAHWVPFMLNLPMETHPGTAFVYCSGGMHVLSGIISKVTGMDALASAQHSLFGSLGIRDASWPSDPDGVSNGWGDLHLHPCDMAKLGISVATQRALGGQANRAGGLHACRSASSLCASWGDTYGYGIWVYPDRQPPIFEANGRGGQRISVIPERTWLW